MISHLAERRNCGVRSVSDIWNHLNMNWRAVTVQKLGSLPTYSLSLILLRLRIFLLFFKHTATPEIYTLSLHDALPIFRMQATRRAAWRWLAEANMLSRDMRRVRLAPLLAALGLLSACSGGGGAAERRSDPPVPVKIGRAHV